MPPPSGPTTRPSPTAPSSPCFRRNASCRTLSSLRISIIWTFAASASACCPCRKYQKLYGAPLVGTRWLLIQLDGEEVANSDGRFSLRFEDAKRLSGRGGCNRYSASCDAEAGGHLRVGPIASTRMTCPEAQRERAFFAMLRSAVRYELDAKMLILSDSIGVRAVFQAAEEDQNTKNQKIN